MLLNMNLKREFHATRHFCHTWARFKEISFQHLSSDHSMGDAEKSDAFDFLVENGILYSKLRNETNDTFLAASSYGNDIDAVSNPNYNNRRMYWTRSHDGCIENLRTGDLILVRQCNFAEKVHFTFPLRSSYRSGRRRRKSLPGRPWPNRQVAKMEVQ